MNFLIAMGVTLFAYIPPGNINLTAVQMAVNKGMKQTLAFIITFSVFEACFTYVLLIFADWFSDKKDFIFWLDWILILVFILLGINSLRGSTKELSDNYKNSKSDGVKTGILLGIINPIQIPFWLLVGAYLISNDWIITEGWGLEVFACGAALGAFITLYLFAIFAQHIQSKFSLSTQIINKGVAIIFFCLAILQLLKIFCF